MGESQTFVTYYDSIIDKKKHAGSLSEVKMSKYTATRV